MRTAPDASPAGAGLHVRYLPAPRRGVGVIAPPWAAGGKGEGGEGVDGGRKRCRAGGGSGMSQCPGHGTWYERMRVPPSGLLRMSRRGRMHPLPPPQPLPRVSGGRWQPHCMSVREWGTYPHCPHGFGRGCARLGLWACRTPSRGLHGCGWRAARAPGCLPASTWMAALATSPTAITG